MYLGNQSILFILELNFVLLFSLNKRQLHLLRLLFRIKDHLQMEFRFLNFLRFKVLFRLLLELVKIFVEKFFFDSLELLCVLSFLHFVGKFYVSRILFESFSEPMFVDVYLGRNLPSVEDNVFG